MLAWHAAADIFVVRLDFSEGRKDAPRVGRRNRALLLQVLSVTTVCTSTMGVDAPDTCLVDLAATSVAFGETQILARHHRWHG